jgi:hypothetical protein
MGIDDRVRIYCMVEAMEGLGHFAGQASSTIDCHNANVTSVITQT